MRPLLTKGWRVRPLMLSIGVIALLLVVKLVGLVQGGPAPAVLARAGRAVMPAAQAASEAHSGHGGHAEPAKSEPAKAVPVPAPAPALPAEPTEPMPTEAERALFKDLRARRSALDSRAQTLTEREAMLGAAEKRLSERVEQLAAMQAKLEALEQTRRERDEANWRGLVKTYEAMRPRDAAAIFNELEQPVLMQMLDRMKEAKAAMVLAAMQPERARAATAQLAQWRNRALGGPQG